MRNFKCPVFPSVPTESRLHSSPPCSGNECKMVWCSLLSDIRKGDSLGLSQEGRELGYTEVNSKKSHKIVKIITGQLLAQQLCGTRDPEDGPLCCGKTVFADHMVSWQASCGNQWLAFVWGTLSATGLW